MGSNSAAAGRSAGGWRLSSALARVSPVFMLLPATVLTFLCTGYLPITDNNIYHLPILLGTYDLPQFADDPFIQSLRHFSSGFWIVFAGIGRVVEPKAFLAGWLVLTHLAFLAAGLHLARSLGCERRATLNVFVLLLAVAAPVLGTTVGGGGILLAYFTHSELANASLLLGFSYALRGRYGHAAVATALTFFLNAFMAIWMIPSLAFLAVYQCAAGIVSPRRLIVEGLAGSAVGAVFLLPPLANFLSNPQPAAPVVFSYGTFLREFFPPHFFIETNSRLELASLAGAIVTVGFVASGLAGRSRPFLMLVAGACALLLVGIVVPFVTEAPLVLNMHLIRGAVMIVMLAAIGLVHQAARWLVEPDTELQRTLGLMLAGTLFAGGMTFLLAVPILALHALLVRQGKSGGGAGMLRRRIGYAFLAAMLLTVPVRLSMTFKGTGELGAISDQWERIGLWSRQHTPAQAVFLILPDTERQQAALGFQYASQRSQRFSEKYGAAVMWSLSYYPLWKRYGVPLWSVVTPAQKMSYAQDARADYLGTECDPSLGSPAHRDGDMCVYAIPATGK